LNRRSFLAGLFASAALVRADRLMPVRSPPILLHGDGVTNDQPAFQAMISGRRVWDVVRRGWIEPRDRHVHIPRGDYAIRDQVRIDQPDRDIDFGGSWIDCSEMPEGRPAFFISADGVALRHAKVRGRGPPFGAGLPPAMFIPQVRPEVAALTRISPPLGIGDRAAGRSPMILTG
jgi:hypothetical protein